VSDKQLIIVGGANGSGRTTFAIPYVKERGYDFLNADEIAKELEIQGKKNALIKAGRIFFSRLDRNIRDGANFVVETTLSGTYINKVAARAKNSGYNLKTVYIFLDNTELCIERVKTRVLKGGHNVPKVDIERRFYRSKNNFWQNFIHLSDEWHLLYNGLESFQQVANGTKSDFSIENELLFKMFKSIEE
jgi:predicted ABC-type ATPase